MKDFGVIVICSKNDLLFAKGCCASIRYFLGDTPICLLVDGDFDLEGLDKTYKTHVIRNKDVKDDFLRAKSFGWGTTRMIAFWESPFEYFLLIDADTCLWGDIRQYAKFEEYDIIIDLPDGEYDEASIHEYFFDLPSFTRSFPDFEVMKHAYVCPAVLFGKRGAINLEEYKAIMAMVEQNPGMFKYGDMGFFNYMLFTGKEQGSIRLGQLDIQYLVPNFGLEQTKQWFAMKDAKPFVQDKTTVIHYCGNAKPVAKNANNYHIAPMTFFRKKYLKDKGIPERLIDFAIQKEDYSREIRLQTNYYKRRIPQLIKSVIG